MLKRSVRLKLACVFGFSPAIFAMSCVRVGGAGLLSATILRRRAFVQPAFRVVFSLLRVPSGEESVQIFGIFEVIAKNGARLRNFIRKRVPDPAQCHDMNQTIAVRILIVNDNGELCSDVADYLERKHTEAALAIASNQVRRFLEAAPTGLMHCSRDLRFLEVNSAYAQIAGLPAGQIVGRMNEVRPVAEVMASLLSEYDETVKRLESLR